jgi:hypothetical protein
MRACSTSPFLCRYAVMPSYGRQQVRNGRELRKARLVPAVLHSLAAHAIRHMSTDMNLMLWGRLSLDLIHAGCSQRAGISWPCKSTSAQGGSEPKVKTLTTWVGWPASVLTT